MIKKAPYLDKTAMAKVRDKNRAWKDYIRLKMHEKFTKTRNELRVLMRKQKVNFECKIANESKANPKAFWGYVRSKSGTSCIIPELKDAQGNAGVTNMEKADLFNTQFASVFTRATVIRYTRA
jgi:hypothetical protein